jgi:hypothetical protein
MKLLNLTSHEVNIFDAKGEQLTVPVSGMLARVKYDYRASTSLLVGKFTVPMVKQTYCGIIDLPPEEEGTICIVSWMVLEAARVHLKRKDLVSPHSSNRAVIRDSYGDVIGVRALRI